MTERPYAEAAWRYRRAGWVGVIPVGYGRRRKNPPVRGYTGWAGLDPSAADVQAWMHGPEGDWNIGLHLPHGIVVPDVDAYNGGDAALARLTAEVGHALPPTWTSTARGQADPSRHRFYRAVLPEGRVWHDHPGGRRSGIDALHIGHRYAVVWPSVHPALGELYHWYDPEGDLWEDVVESEDFAELDPAWVEILSKPGEPMPGTAADDATTLEVLRAFRRAEDGQKACYVVRKAFQAEWARIQGARDRETAGGLHEPGALHHLVALGLEGHQGVRAALSRHQAAYTAARVEFRDEREAAAAADWWRMVRGSVGKWLHEHGEAVTECDCGKPPVTAPVTAPERSEHPADDLPEPPAEEPWAADDSEVPPEAPDPDGLDPITPDEEVEHWGARVDRKVLDLQLLDEAKDKYAGLKHARTWTPPVSYGSLTDELAMPDDEPRWRFHGMLGVGHNALVVAGRKTGKTTLVGNVVRAYADGKPFLGRFDVTQPDPGASGNVAIFNYEVDERQYRRWLRDVDVVNTDRVHVLHLRGRTLPLKNERVQAWVARWLAERQIGLWIVDPYSRAYVGSVDNGNDEAQVGAFLDTLDVIKVQAGVSELVMPVHTPKARAEAGEETAIGSQRLEGWPDAMWYMTRDLETGGRFLRAEGRDVLLPEEQLVYHEGDRELILSGGGNRADAKRNADMLALLAHIDRNPGCTSSDICRALKWGNDRLKDARAAAAESVRTQKVGTSLAHYRSGS
jgi:hypothetical protein